MRTKTLVIGFIMLSLFLLSITVAYGQEAIDTSTQRNGMHACPDGQFMTGVDVGGNRFLCSGGFDTHTVSQEFVDGDNELTVSHDMHACPDGTAMTGLHADNNWLSCAPVPGGIQTVIVDGDDEAVTVRNNMHACPDGTIMTGIHVGNNYLLCGVLSIGYKNSNLGTSLPTGVSETLTDRCSGDVVISQHYSTDDEVGPIDQSQMKGIALVRNESGRTDWSALMPVNGHSWIRWWCHSITGNILDPGTWRIQNLTAGADCTGDWELGQVDDCSVTGSVEIFVGAEGDWTPERSRCESNDTVAISARLGPNRLLEIECLAYE